MLQHRNMFRYTPQVSPIGISVRSTATIFGNLLKEMRRGKFRVFDRLAKVFVKASMALVLGAPILSLIGGAAFAQTPAPATPAPAAGAPAAPVVKDQGEYDAIQAVSKETDPVKKLDLLKAWQDKYPDSQFKNQRLLQFVDTWSKIATKALTTSPATPVILSAAKDAANSLISNLDAAFSTEAKPPAVTDDQWKQARGQVEQQAHMVLGYVALQNKDYPTAEAEFKTFAGLNDQNAQVAYWWGTAIASEHQVPRTPEALYQFSRAVSISGAGALTPAGKKSADEYLTKSWNGYVGDDDAKGLSDLKDLAAKSAVPPDDIDKTILSVVEREKLKSGSDEQYLAAHPDVKLWRDLKATLTAADGEEYFNKSVKGALIPQVFNAKIVSWTPETNPTEVRISIEDPSGDAVIKYEKPLHAKLNAGDAVTIKGNAMAFTKDPFLVTFDGDQSVITGIVSEKPAARRPVHHK